MGLFSALYSLEESGQLAEYEAAWFEEQERWFNEHLKGPRPLSDPKAILWFKPTALEHIARMRALAALLEHKDTPVDVIESDRPGYVIYEDEYQIAAVPFVRETF